MAVRAHDGTVVRRRAVCVAVAVVGGVVAAGCGGSHSETTATADVLTPESDQSADVVASSIPQPSSSEGISFEEAVANSVLTGEYDALVHPLGRAPDGAFQFELRNIGHLDDSYNVAVEVVADAEASVEPAIATLAAGSTASLTVVVSAGSPDDVELVVTSAGVGGAELVRVPVTWKG